MLLTCGPRDVYSENEASATRNGDGSQPGRAEQAPETAASEGVATLPELSRFLGIVIYMLYDDHRPPHFHAEYGEYRITVEVRSGIVEGRFPRRALNAVLEWHELHRDELLADWVFSEQHQPLVKIPPLE